MEVPGRSTFRRKHAKKSGIDIGDLKILMDEVKKFKKDFGHGD
jgi:hypothetical protein